MAPLESVVPHRIQNPSSPPLDGPSRMIHSAWSDYRVCSVKGVKVGSTAELLKAREDGKVVITSKNGSVAEYGKVLYLLENDEIPTIVNLKKSDFDCLSGSPQRFFLTKAGPSSKVNQSNFFVQSLLHFLWY